MKVYLSNYRDHWLSPYTILEKVFFWREIDYDEPIIEKWSDRLLPICLGIQKLLDTIHPRVNYVKIEHYDTWSMDTTLAHIILPMLKQLRDTKHGSPHVDPEDVPEDLRINGHESWSSQLVFEFENHKQYETDSWDITHRRWTWVLNEMIFAFECVLNEDWDEQFWTGEWGKMEFEETGEEAHNPITNKVEKLSKVNITGNRECDWVARQKVQDRISNGLRLFGKYYQGLWD